MIRYRVATLLFRNCLMKTKFPYQKPLLHGLLDSRACEGASCGSGNFTTPPDDGCGAGSCYALSSCLNGTMTRACSKGVGACQGDAAFTCCVYGAGVTGGTKLSIWTCSATGNQACDLCSTGGLAMWCGGGNTPV